MEHDTDTVELQQVLGRSQVLAEQKSVEIIGQEWPKIQQTFAQLITEGERDMKFSVEVMLNSTAEGIGVKAGIAYKIVRKARVGEAFARYDGTTQQELPLSENADAPEAEPVDLAETAKQFGYADIDALFAAARGIVTEAKRNSAFLIIRQIGVTLDEANAIMDTMRAAGELNPDYDLPANVGAESETESTGPVAENVPDGSATEQVQTEAQLTEAEINHGELVDKAVDVLGHFKNPSPIHIKRKLKLSAEECERIFHEAMTKLEELRSAAAASESTSANTCDNCAKAEECPLKELDGNATTCSGFEQKGQ